MTFVPFGPQTRYEPLFWLDEGDDRAVRTLASLLPIIAPWEGSAEIDIREMRPRDPDITLHLS